MASPWAIDMTFPDGVPIEPRVEVVAPVINAMIAAFEMGEIKDGCQYWQEHVINKIRTAMLLVDMNWMNVDFAGVHPDNREGAGYVPIDVHDLLLRIVNDGWSYLQVVALAAQIPPTPTGDEWRSFNERLAAGSNGLLAPVRKSFLEIVTVRGSHTTAAVRLYKHGAKGVHDSLCIDGIVSQSKIIEKRPSMAEPISKGLPYTIIKWQLVEACPRLMGFLARTGNSNHGVHRVATTLQGCMSVYNSYKDQKESQTSWELAGKSASQGQPPDS